MNDILDDFESNSTPKIRVLDLIPYGLIGLLFIVKIYYVLFKNYVFSFESIISYLLIALSLAILYFNRKRGAYILMLTLLVSSFGILYFFPFKIEAHVFLTFNPITSFLAIITYLIFKSDLELSSNNLIKREQRIKTEQTNSFIDKYQSLPDQDLVEVINGNYRDEAKSAAKIILASRKT